MFEDVDRLWREIQEFGKICGPAWGMMSLGTARWLVANEMTRDPEFRDELNPRVLELIDSDLSDDKVIELFVEGPKDEG